jgi:uncharacterized OB-fold protein
MMNDRREMIKLSCNRCMHSWFPRSEIGPEVCPRCKSPYWNKERRDVKP